MWKASLCTLIILISGSVMAIEKCNNVGLFPSDDTDKFILCTKKDGRLMRSELSCSNLTEYSGVGATCETKDTTKIQIYNLLSSGVTKSSDEITIGCVTPGTICSSCKELSVCAGDVNPDGSETFNVLYKEKCSKDEHCAIGKGCTSDEQYPCSLGPFQCDDVGSFPDPYDCKIYHFCEEGNLDKPLTFTCTGGSFNSKTMTCGYSMDSEECQMRPVPLCRNLFQVGQVTNNAKMYYICVKSKSQPNALTPSLHSCPPQTIFNVDSLSCISEANAALVA